MYRALILTGIAGVGKSTVADAVGRILSTAGCRRPRRARSFGLVRPRGIAGTAAPSNARARDVVVVLEQDGLKLRYAGGAPASLKHWHGDTFRLSWTNPFSQGRPTFVTFGLDAKGNVNRLSAEILRDQIDAARVTLPAPSR